MTVRSAQIVLTADASQAVREVNRLSAEVQKTGRALDGSTKKATGSVFGLSRGLAAVGGAAALGKVVKDSADLEQQFSKTMRTVAASTGTPQAEIAKLSDLAMKLGADTVYSANDAAGAMLELAKAGISTSDIMGGSLQGTLLLAAAGGTELGTAATIASNAMNTFSLSGKDMDAVAAALAGGANASSASVESLGQALQQVGPGAVNAGLSLQETVGVLSAFDAAGIKGSDAGTSLKTMLTSLAPQTDKARDAMAKYNLDFIDAEGNFLAVTEVAGQLQRQLGDLSEAERTRALSAIFGSDASRAATVLMKEGADGVRDFIKATQDQNAAQEMADAAMAGTSGAVEKLSGAVETAQLALGQALAPTLVEVADWLSDDVVPGVTDFISGMQEGSGAGGDFAAVLGDVRDIGGDVVDVVRTLAPLAETLADGWSALPDPMKSAVVQLGAFSLLAGKLRTGAGGMGLSGWVTDMRDIEKRAGATSTALGKMRTAGRNVGMAAGFMAITEGAQQSNDAIGTLMSAGGGALMGFAVGGPIGAAIGGAAGGLYSLAANAETAEDAARRSMGTWQEYAATLDQITGATTEMTRTEVSKNLVDSGAIAHFQQLGIGARTAVDAVLGMPRASKQVTAALATEQTAVDALVAHREELVAAYEAQANASGTTLTRTQQQQLDGMASEIDLRQRVIDSLATETGALGDAARRKQEELAVTRSFSKALDSLPRDVRTQIRAEGLQFTDQAIIELVAKYDSLDRRDIATLIRENGGQPTKKMIDNIIAAADALNRRNPKPKLSAQDNASGVIRDVEAYLRRIHGSSATTYIRTVRIEERRDAVRSSQAHVGGGIGASSGGRRTPGSAMGSTVPKSGLGYADRYPYLLADGEEVVSNRRGQADRYRPVLKAINADLPPGLVKAMLSFDGRKVGRLAAGGTVGSRLEILEAEARVRDLQAELASASSTKASGSRLDILEAQGRVKDLAAELKAATSKKASGSRLEIMEARQAIREINRDLRARKTKRVSVGKGKTKEVDAGYENTGLKRKILVARRREAERELKALQQAPKTSQLEKDTISERLAEARAEEARLRGATPSNELDKSILAEQLKEARAELARLRGSSAAAERAEAVQSVTDRFTGQLDIFARGSSAGAAVASVTRQTGDTVAYGQVISRLRAAGASEALLQQISAKAESGDVRAATRLGTSLLGQPAALQLLNARLGEHTAAVNSVAQLTANPSALMGAAWSAGSTTVEKRVEVQIQALDVSAVSQEITRLVRHVITSEVVPQLGGWNG